MKVNRGTRVLAHQVKKPPEMLASHVEFQLLHISSSSVLMCLGQQERMTHELRLL